jgi:hypothetical protein
MLYQTSKKAVLQRDGYLGYWAGQHGKASQYIGVGLLVISFVAMGFLHGLGAGILTQFIVLMTVGSLIVCVSPLKVVDYRGLSIIFLGCLLLEITLF